MKKYLLVLGGNLLACLSLERLRAGGYSLAVLDRSMDAPAKDVAEIFMPVNIADPEAVLSAVKDLQLEGVMAINDFGVRTAACVSADRGLPGFSVESADNVCNKVRMKQCWVDNGLPTAKHTWTQKEALIRGEKLEWNAYPCIVKPAFAGGGSRGVFLAHDETEVREGVAAWEHHYIDNEVVVEEFLSGYTEHTAEVLISGGRTHIMSISDKINYVGSSTIVQTLFFPGSKGNIHRNRLEPLLHEACIALGLEEGCAHFEVLIKGDEVSLLEVGGRPGGGQNFHPISFLTTGYDYPMELASILTGRGMLLRREDNVWHIGWHFFSVECGTLEEVRGYEAVAAHPAVIDARLNVRVGEPVCSMSNDLQRPGYFMVKARTADEAEQLVAELASMVEFRVTKEG
jgi:biotin carboxylase